MAGGHSGAVRGNAGGHDGGFGATILPDGSAIPGGVRSAGCPGTKGRKGKALISDLRVLLVPVLHVPLLVKVGADGEFDEGFRDTVKQNIN